MFYDLDGSGLRQDSKHYLDSLVPKMLLIDSCIFALESYTDCRSSAEYNKDLSKRRADQVVEAIKIIAPDLLVSAFGLGEDSLLNDCSCEGTMKQTTTKYYKDTIDGVVQNRFELNDSLEKEVMIGNYHVPCSEYEHQRNRRTVLRIVGIRRD